MKAVILAGGSGTRLWPLSDPKYPTQFQPLTSKETLFQNTNDALLVANKKSTQKIKNLVDRINKNHK
jgi:mannose-1-phosphate guanylyltransferase